MHRSQVLLEEKHYRFLVDEAKRRRQTISSVLRDWIDHRMQSQEQRPLDQDPLWEMVGIAQGGKGKISEDHDLYLANKKMMRMVGRPSHAPRTRKKS